MQRFKSAEQAQRFLSAHGVIYGHFRPRRHLMTAGEYRRARNKAVRIWQQETCVQTASRSCSALDHATDLPFLSNNLPMPPDWLIDGWEPRMMCIDCGSAEAIFGYLCRTPKATGLAQVPA
ncbi:hypothetical protein [Muricoccus aerilatus]|uniref:hypothetical protein n=1 Tax=Muricoccus aerilatus TaxID=452982 RepID=UPI0005C253F3